MWNLTSEKQRFGNIRFPLWLHLWQLFENKPLLAGLLNSLVLSRNSGSLPSFA